MSTFETTWQGAKTNCVLLRKLPSGVFGYVIRSSKLVKYGKADVVYSQGQHADSFYVVNSGTFKAMRLGADGKTQEVLRVFATSATFGSHALLHDVAREETVIAESPGSSAWLVSKKVFDAKLRHAPLPPPSLVNRLKLTPLFDGLPIEHVTMMARAANDIQIQKQQLLYTQGDVADCIYVLEEGSIKLVSDGNEQAKLIVRAPAKLGLRALYADATEHARACR